MRYFKLILNNSLWSLWKVRDDGAEMCIWWTLHNPSVDEDDIDWYDHPMNVWVPLEDNRDSIIETINNCRLASLIEDRRLIYLVDQFDEIDEVDEDTGYTDSDYWMEITEQEMFLEML